MDPPVPGEYSCFDDTEQLLTESLQRDPSPALASDSHSGGQPPARESRRAQFKLAHESNSSLGLDLQTSLQPGDVPLQIMDEVWPTETVGWQYELLFRVREQQDVLMRIIEAHHRQIARTIEERIMHMASQNFEEPTMQVRSPTFADSVACSDDSGFAQQKTRTLTESSIPEEGLSTDGNGLDSEMVPVLTTETKTGAIMAMMSKPTQDFGEVIEKGRLKQLSDWCRRYWKRTTARFGCCAYLERNFLKAEVETPRMDIVVGIIICINALTMVTHYHWLGIESAILLGMRDPDTSLDIAKDVFLALEHVFAFFFTMELLVRFYLNGLAYLADAGNIFDVFLVVTSIVDLAMTWAGKDGAANLTIMRFGRLLKFLRVMRIFRSMKVFSSLRILVRTIYSSGRALIWSMVLLGILMLIGGLCLCQLAREYIQDDRADRKHRKDVYHLYGDPARSVFSMFEATFSGCWPVNARPLIDNIGPGFALFWVVYTTFVIFAVIRIITALFLKETLQNAGADNELMINEEIARKQKYIAKLSDAFQEMGGTGGCLNWEEFSEVMANPRVKAYLSVLELEVHESTLLFKLLDDGDGRVTFTEFLEGVQRLRGAARTLDLMCVQHDCMILNKGIKQVNTKLDTVLEQFGANATSVAYSHRSLNFIGTGTATLRTSNTMGYQHRDHLSRRSNGSRISTFTSSSAKSSMWGRAISIGRPSSDFATNGSSGNVALCTGGDLVSRSKHHEQLASRWFSSTHTKASRTTGE